MKTREEQYEEVLKEFIKKNHSELIDDDFALGYGFQEGVKWADDNPRDCSCQTCLELEEKTEVK